MPSPLPTGPLRIVTFNVMPFAYRCMTSWITNHSHEHVAVITTPGPIARRSASYHEIVTHAPPAQDVIVTTHVTRLIPYLTALAPDLIMSFTFPYRLPETILRIPRYGAVNLHPTLLPHYRGPNPARPLYDGVDVFGATLHWMDAQFDTGPILAQHTVPVPAELTPESIGRGIYMASAGALEQGMERVQVGDAGYQQDHAQASYAAQFSDADERLRWDVSTQRLYRQFWALKMFQHPAFLVLHGVEYQIARLHMLSETTTQAPGTVLTHDGADYTVATADGVVALTVVTPETHP